jgi:hypothetical protein
MKPSEDESQPPESPERPPRRHHYADSRPDDLIGSDASGRVRIDRVIPLHWVIGIIGASAINAAATYYGQQQLIEKVAEMRGEIRAITSSLAAGVNQGTEHSMRLRAIERRLDQIELRK